MELPCLQHPMSSILHVKNRLENATSTLLHLLLFYEWCRHMTCWQLLCRCGRGQQGHIQSTSRFVCSKHLASSNGQAMTAQHRPCRAFLACMQMQQAKCLSGLSSRFEGEVLDLTLRGLYGRAIWYASNADSPHVDRKSTRLNSSHSGESRMPSSA